MQRQYHSDLVTVLFPVVCDSNDEDFLRMVMAGYKPCYFLVFDLGTSSPPISWFRAGDGYDARELDEYKHKNRDWHY